MRRLACAFTVLAAGVALAAEQAPPPQPAAPAPATQTQPRFRAGTNYVQLDVIVTDKDDRPVLDLTAADFEIREGGRMQTVEDFEHVVVPPTARAIDLSRPGTPSLDTVSNAVPASTSRAFVFVIDEGSIEGIDIVPLKSAMKRFIERLGRTDKVAIAYVGRSDLGQDFTSDTARLVSSINHLTRAYGSAATVDARLPVRLTSGRAMIEVLRNVVTTLSVAREPRRAVVLVSRGAYSTTGPGRVQSDEWQEFYERARKTAVPIYSIDPTGLLAPELGFEGRLEDQTPANRANLDTLRRSGLERLREISLNTGGQALVDRATPRESVDLILADNSHYYLLGYYPSPYVADGKYHDVSVNVKRPGLRVRSRSGYTSGKATPARSGNALVESLTAGLPGGDLPLRAVAVPMPTGAKTASTLIALDVDLGPTTREADAGDVFQIAWVAVDADGRVKASNQTSVNVPVRTAVRRSDVVGLYDVLELPDSAKTLRIAVSSGAARQSGTVHLPIERIEPGTFAASPLLIGLDGGDGRQLARLSSRASASTFPPATTRTFNRNRRLRVFSLVTEKPTIAALRLSTPDDRLINTIPVAQSASADVAGAVDLKATVDLSRLAPGQYVLELVVTNPKADQVRRAVAFEVR